MIFPDNFENKIGFTAVREAIKSYCACDDAKAMVTAISFCKDFTTVSDTLKAVSEYLESLTADSDSHIPLDFLPQRSMAETTARLRLQGSTLDTEQIDAVRRTLQCAEQVNSFFNAIRQNDNVAWPQLERIVADLLPLPMVIRLIDRVIDTKGEIKDNASPELASIRQQISAAGGMVNTVMRRIMAQASAEGWIDHDTTPTVRDGRLVVPVAPMNKRKIPGIVHDESSTGKTIYIEPAEVVEANNRLRQLQLDERREVARILAQLTDELRPSADTIEVNVDVLTRLDFTRAKALFAKDTDATLPTVHDHPVIEWYGARHPELLLSLRRQGRDIVPLDIVLPKGDRILVISGPNAGGKSICLKTAGITQYMAQCGILPCVWSNSHIGIFESIFIDIGDDQSIENDLSTYSSHLRNMKRVLTGGSDRALVLVDEFGGGTEPQIGGAIAQAILAELNRKQVWGVITTHYQNLKHFAEDTCGLVNGSMLYDRHLMKPLFRLSVGQPGSSFALEIARQTGLPQNVIDSAREIVGSDYVNMDRYLLDIARDRKYWENKRMDIRQKEKRIEQAIERYETEADQLRSKRREIISEAQEEAKKILQGSNAAIERTIRDIKQAQAERNATLEARRKLEETKKAVGALTPDESLPKELKKKTRKKSRSDAKPTPAAPTKKIEVGDMVKMEGQSMPGRVTEISGNKATVTFGILKTTIALDRLRHTQAKEKSATEKAASFV
ncbi:MAG: endonuclease MutS2 [Muribaculaceae bacterium]|nr:endonuclease MutS2 [Muribaculaceae bacterium]